MKSQKLISAILIVVLLLSLCACGQGSSPVSGETAAAAPAPTEAISKLAQSGEASTTTPSEPATQVENHDDTLPEPTVNAQYSITEALTPFSDNRAWVQYNTSTSYDTERYGVIDSNGFLIWSIAKSDLSAWGKVSTSTFEDGLSCLYANRRDGKRGMIILDSTGTVVFDSRNSSDGESWCYLGYGDGTFLALQNVANFSDNNTYICEINSSGNIVYMHIAAANGR